MKSWLFDFETGDFVVGHNNDVLVANENEAIMQWCMKAVLTERYAHVIYSDEYGTDIEQIMQQPNFGLSAAIAENSIKQNLLKNEMIKSIDNFTFYRSDKDSLVVEFTVSPVFGEQQKITISGIA